MEKVISDTYELVDSVIKDIWNKDSLLNNRQMIKNKFAFNTLYVRKQIKICNTTRTVVFCIAVIELKPKFRGKGILDYFINKLIEQKIPIYVESILESRLEEYLLKRGFSYHDPYNMFYLPE
jgi:hypothetical protein